MRGLVDGITRLRWRWALVLASCLVATSCSMMKFGYESLPRWGKARLGEYFALDVAQSRFVDSRLDALHAWHRASQLPEYAAQLRAIEKQIRTDQPIDATEINAHRDRIMRKIGALLEQAVPDFATLVLTMKPQQFEHLRQRQQKSNTEYRKDHLQNDALQRLDARIKRTSETAEFFFGRLNDAQRAIVARHAAEYSGGEDAAAFEARLTRQRRFADTLEQIAAQQPPLADASRRIGDMLRELFDPTPTTAGAEGQRRRAERSGALIGELLAAAGQRQRDQLSDRLLGLARDCESLAGTAKTATLDLVADLD